MNEGAWRKVVRRKPFPSNWRHAPEPPTSTKPFAPYQPSFAQVVQRSPLNDIMPPRLSPLKRQPSGLSTAPLPNLPITKPTSLTINRNLKHNPTSKPPIATTNPQLLPSAPRPTSTLTKNQYISNHTKPALRFPPSPTYPEWRGRCFRCCQPGHTVTSCRSVTKCGKCWGNGHIGARCKKALNPTANPYQPKPAQCLPPTYAFQPSFDELLEGNLPIEPRPLPRDRPTKTYCFITRDEVH